MRITVVEFNGSGGLIHFAFQLCTALAKAGADVTLVTSRHYEFARWPHAFSIEPRLQLWPLTERDTAGRSADWWRLWRKARRVLRGAVLLREWTRLTWFLFAQRPDIVQFSSFPFPAFSVFLHLLRRRGLYLTQICHEYEERDLVSGEPNPIRRYLLRNVHGQMDEIFFISEFTRQSFMQTIAAPVEHTHLIPHGNQEIFRRCARQDPDLKMRYGFAADELVALFFGTIRPSKGVDDLLEAFALLQPAPRTKLLIVGYPTKYADMRELRAAAARFGVESKVVFDARYIPMEDVGALVELATVVVFPYRSATQSGALQVAYTFGKPVITTDAGGLSEAVIPSRTGLVVPSGSPRALAAALQQLLLDPDRARWMGQQATQISETEHSWAAIAAILLRVYRCAVAREAARDLRIARANEERN